MRLSRNLAVDMGLEGSRDKRQLDEDDEWFIWTYLVPRDRLPSAEVLYALLQALERHRFCLAPDVGGKIAVYQADIGNRDCQFDSTEMALLHLASKGGGILLEGCGTSIGFVADPGGIAHQKIIRAARLPDQVAFGEYALWLPTSEGDWGIEDNLAEERMVEAIPDVEKTLNPAYGYSIATNDIGNISKRWRSHSEVSTQQIPSELFWYQYFEEKYARSIPRKDFRDLGFSLIEWEGGTSALLMNTPGMAMEMLERVRKLWPYGLTPVAVC